MKKITEDKRRNKNCAKCGKLCFGTVCRKCFRKDKYKGRVSVLNSMRNRK